MSGQEILAGLIGVLAPVVVAAFKRLNLNEKMQNLVTLIILIVITGIMMVGSGEISLHACSGLGLEECVGVVYKYVGLVIGGAFLSYKLFWQALGIDDKVAGKVAGK
jgi:hypothetical protein